MNSTPIRAPEFPPDLEWLNTEPASASRSGLFVADTNNHAVRFLDLSGGSLETLDFSGF